MRPKRIINDAKGLAVMLLVAALVAITYCALQVVGGFVLLSLVVGAVVILS